MPLIPGKIALDMNDPTNSSTVTPTVTAPAIENETVPDGDLRVEYELRVGSQEGMVLHHRSSFDLHGALTGHLREQSVQNMEIFLNRALVNVVVCEVRAFMNSLTKMERELAAAAAGGGVAVENRAESPAKPARKITIHPAAEELPGSGATEQTTTSE